MSLKISRILHAGYVFECDETRIAFDPIFENPFSHNCYAFPDVSFDLEKIRQLSFDAVFISHFHDDHFSLESLNLLNRQIPIYAFSVFDELFMMLRELGFINVHKLIIDEAIQMGAIKIIPRKSLDADIDSIFQIQAVGLNVLNVVDAWIDPETLEKLVQFDWQLVLWPFQTMREIEVLSPKRAAMASLGLPIEWIEQLKVLRPQYIVPSSCQFIHESWSWLNQALFPISYRRFEMEVKGILKGTKVVRLEPSISVVLDINGLKYAEPLNWVSLVDNKKVDYNYDAQVQVPKTSDISRRFAAINEQQTQLVYDYCTTGLLQKFNSLELSLSLYFGKPRIWRLTVYDHLGEAKQFVYSINVGIIERIFDEVNVTAWSTEIPLAKLYSALQCGEALTSLYIRINDENFSEEIENELATADCMEDPLINCLFTGVFGSYQRAQLKRLSELSI